MALLGFLCYNTIMTKTDLKTIVLGSLASLEVFGVHILDANAFVYDPGGLEFSTAEDVLGHVSAGRMKMFIDFDALLSDDVWGNVEAFDS